jgi:transcriptional regulator with XRE-family HTH domain
MAKLRNRFLILLTEKERREDRRITYTEIAKATGSSINIISNWAKNKIARFDAPMLEKLCEYFGCEVGDLLYLDHSGDGSTLP